MIEKVRKSKKCRSWHQGKYNSIFGKEIPIKYYPNQGLSVQNGIPITVDKKVEWNAVNNRVYFEVDTQSIDEASDNIIFVKQKV